MGDFGAARRLPRSEWCWLFPQARLPHMRPRAVPLPPPLPGATDLQSLGLAGLIDGLLTPSKHPTPSPVPSRPSPQPTSSEDPDEPEPEPAAAPSRRRAGPSPRSPWHPSP